MIYDKLDILDDSNKDLKVNKLIDYSFAKKINSSPIALIELFSALGSYPIVFQKNKDNTFSSIAIFYVKDDFNPFISDSGIYNADKHIPLFFKQYPFIYVDTGNDEWSLAYDNNEKYISSSAELNLFNDDGKPSPYFQEKIQEINDFHVSNNEMSNSINILHEAGVLENFDKELTVENSRINLKGYMFVNEKKLNDLKDEQILSLVKSGAYKIALAQLISMNNFKSLVSNI